MLNMCGVTNLDVVIQKSLFLQVERFKELELERYKLLERDRVNKDFNKKLSDYETEYRQRLDGLHRREVESTRAIDKLVSASCLLESWLVLLIL